MQTVRFLLGTHTGDIGCIVDGNIVHALDMPAQHGFDGGATAHQDPQLFVTGFRFVVWQQVWWHHVCKVNASRTRGKKLFHQARVMFFKQRTHQAKEGMRMTKLCSPTALPGEKRLICITLGRWNIPFKKRNGMIRLSQ